MKKRMQFCLLKDGDRFDFYGETFIKVLEESDHYNAVNAIKSSDCIKLGPFEIVEKV